MKPMKPEGVSDEVWRELRAWHEHIELIVQQDRCLRGVAVVRAYREGPGGVERRRTGKRLH